MIAPWVLWRGMYVAAYSKRGGKDGTSVLYRMDSRPGKEREMRVAVSARP